MGHVRRVLNVLTAKQWATIREKGLAGALPTDVYLDGEFPNSGIHLSPKPSATPDIELYYWAELTQFVDLANTVDFPPGYYDALKYNLALQIAKNYNRIPKPTLIAKAQQRKQAIQELNAQILNGSFQESRTLTGPNIGTPSPEALQPPQPPAEPGQSPEAPKNTAQTT